MKLFKIFYFIFIPEINWLASRMLRVFSMLIPDRYQFPVRNFFKVKVCPGVTFYIEGHLTSYITTVCFWKGIKGFEYDAVKIFSGLVGEMSMFIDIGANIGYYSLIATSINKDLKIIAFEPFHDACQAFRRNIERNRFRNIRVEEIALSDKAGNAILYYAQSNVFPDYRFQLGGKNSLIEYKDKLHGKVKIKTMTLDDYAMQNKIDDADLLKMDTESTEYFILKGGETYLEKSKPIIQCEVLKGFNEDKLEELLLRFGYLFYQVKKEGLHLRKSLKGSPNHKNDYFFIPDGKEYLIKRYLVD